MIYCLSLARNFAIAIQLLYFGRRLKKVTQQRYQDVLQENIFKPLNMHNTGYDSHAKIINQRASGYSNNLDGYTNADYLDMSIPYAAGVNILNRTRSRYDIKRCATNKRIIKN